MKRMGRLFVPLIIMLMVTGCRDQCAECLEMTPKYIHVMDQLGNNLVFGPTARYHPDSVRMFTENGDEVYLLRKDTPGFLQFMLERNNIYILKLADTVADTLAFSLAFRKSEKCCGDITYSSATYHNSDSISNSDTVVIIRQIR